VLVALQLLGGLVVATIGFQHIIDTDLFYGKQLFSGVAFAADAWFFILLLIGMRTAPHCAIVRSPSRRLLDWGGWVAGIVLAVLALHCCALIPSLVHSAINGVEVSIPYRISSGIIYEMDVVGKQTALTVL
jgi:hypothetical protein